jgi:acylaminoacyl-peptidase
MLVVRNPSGTVNNVILELWGGGRVLREVEVPASVHGPAYADGWFEGVAWSSAEDHVAYVAEAPAAVRTPLWGGRAPPGSSDAATAGWRGQSEHVEDWGEQLTGKKCAALFVVDVPSGAVHAVRGLPADSSCGQVVWAPGDTALVFTAWPFAAKNFNTLRRLGAIYCLNRPCAIYTVAAPAGGETAPAVCLTPALASAFSPRFSPSGTSLALASNDAACASGAAAGLTTLRSRRCALALASYRGSRGASWRTQARTTPRQRCTC